MTAPGTSWCWPAGELGAAVAAAAAHTGIAAAAPDPVDVRYDELADRLLASAPAIVRVDDRAAPEHAIVVGARGRRLTVLAPDLTLHTLDVDVLVARLCAAIEAPLRPAIDALLDKAGLPPDRAAAARRAILRQQLGSRPVEGIAQLRPPPGERMWRGLRRSGAMRHLATMLGAHVVQYALWVVSWWLVGRAALDGRFDDGWFAGWVLLLASLVPFRLLATWSQGAFAVEAGSVLKQKLLDAALCLDPQAVRGDGVGTFVGRVIEAEAIGSLALGGGVLAGTAALELAIAGLLLGLGGSGPLALLLLLWVALTLGAGTWCLSRRLAWTRSRLDLTHDLVEKMVGHRTRLVQAHREHWHAGEDVALERYLRASERLDRATTWLLAVAPRGWVLLGLLGLGLRFVWGTPSPGQSAIELGGVLLAFQAIVRLTSGLADLGAAVIGWRQVAPMIAALEAAEPSPAPPWSPAVAGRATPGDRDGGRPQRLLGAHHVAFTHARRARPVLQGLDLEIFAGDRILLEGASGSGKSTLAALLTGQRVPDAGVVLLGGVDRQTLGADAWRRRVAAAPQFHENHVLTGSLAFNLLMGRRWPPRDEDVRQAEELCRELGLADLLARMPSGLFEMVGESGWQLSHGERSRLFMARALLQPSDIVVLDESFTALDPSTQGAALRCALARTKTLMVIAHP